MAELVPSPAKEPIDLPPPPPPEEPPIDPASLPTEDTTGEDHRPCRFFQEGRCRFGSCCRNYHAGAAVHQSEDHEPPHCPPPQPPSGKKPAMKTADDVISRILWDAQVPTEGFSIGYLDRFLGILEEPFTAFSWEDLASVGPGVLAIPKHRIQYFKYRSRLVWDKASRTDDVFGSTGSGTTILEVIKEEKEAVVAAGEKAHTDSSNGDGGKVVGTEGQGMAEHTEAMEDSSSTRKREEWLDRGTDGPEMGNLNPDGITPTSLGEDAAGEEARAMVSSHTGRHSIQEDDLTEGNGRMVENEEKVAFKSRGKSFPLPKHRPTHFIAIRITSPEIREAVSRVQGALGDIRPDLAEFCVDVATLHLTLCLLHLESPEEIHNAITALQELQANSQRLLPPALLLSFQGVENFNSRVLYMAPASAPQLGLLARILQDAFKKKGLMVIHPPYKETFHLTMVKIPARKGRQLPAHSSWVPSVEDIGTQAVEALYFCEMGQGRKTDGFYTTLLKLDLY
ncbi:hypothetical protein lerEdw1_006971 [Lerista edwardsae]|nr:hypothetical protein lerEdw1_006971 [Lerista edwardsae]